MSTFLIWLWNPSVMWNGNESGMRAGGIYLADHRVILMLNPLVAKPIKLQVFAAWPRIWAKVVVVVFVSSLSLSWQLFEWNLYVHISRGAFVVLVAVAVAFGQVKSRPASATGSAWFRPPVIVAVVIISCCFSPRPFLSTVHPSSVQFPFASKIQFCAVFGRVFCIFVWDTLSWRRCYRF